MEKHDIEGAIEGILFVSGEPVKIGRIATVLDIPDFVVEETADIMRDKYSFERRGIRMVKLDGALQLCSSPEFADIIRQTLEVRKPPKLTHTALEVLSIIAYFQPVTKAYLEQLRGVDCTYTVGILLDRGLIEQCGHLDAPGRPRLYRTTHVFLRTFGLQSLKELPELPQIEETPKDGIQNAILELQARETDDPQDADADVEVADVHDTEVDDPEPDDSD